MFSESTMTMPVSPMNYGGNGMFGDGNGWWVLIILFALFGGWGGNGFGASGGVTNEVQRGFDNQSVLNKLNGIENGLCDGFYAMNTGMLNGFHGVDNAISRLGYETNRNIDSVRYEAAQNTCAITSAIHAEGEETRRLIEKNEIQALRDKVAELQLAQSQCAQNAYLVNQLRPCPIPAYLSCSPYATYNGCCGI